MPKPTEVATISAGGEIYAYWTSIEIERVYGQAVSYMTFTCAEPSDSNATLATMKLGIGVAAQGFLAGILAITGVVDTREVSYDAKKKAVRIRVASRTQEVVASTVDGTPGQYRNYNFQQIATAVAGKVGVNVIVNAAAGADKVFERVSEHIGETRFSFLEVLSRWRNLHVRDDESGNLVFERPSSDGGASAQLIEGQNIVAARILMRNDFAVAQVTVNTALHGNDDHWADDARNISATASNPNYSSSRAITLAGEQPEDQQGAQMRANHEMNLNDLTICEATVTVQGWLMDDGSLWCQHLGEDVSVYSPMLLPNGSDSITLKLKGARHLQDNEGGTRTDVILCLKSGLGGSQQVDFPGAS